MFPLFFFICIIARVKKQLQTIIVMLFTRGTKAGFSRRRQTQVDRYGERLLITDLRKSVA